jgi:hypothetical protein
MVPKKKDIDLYKACFLEKISLKKSINKKMKSGKKRKKPTTPFAPTQEQLLGRRRKERENSTLTFRNNQTSPLSHVNQETTPH